MDELTLSKDLWVQMVAWMRLKYSANSVRQYSLYLKKVFKKHSVLNHTTLKEIMKGVKHQNQRACLVMINDYCYDNDIDFNMRIPSVKKQASKLPNILSPSEIKVLIGSAPKPYDLALRCIFNMGAGLRVSEIIKMSWNHIRWVDWMENKEDYGVCMIKGGKGAKDRIVNIPKKLMQDLYDYAKERETLNEFSIPHGGMVFDFSYSDKPFRPQLKENNLDLWKREYVQVKYDWFRHNIIEKCCEKALNKRVNVHQLRHSRATYLHEVEKVPIEDLQVLLGHKSLGTTMIYTKIDPKGIFKKLSNTEEV